jgi:hypothetical protein
MNSIIRWKRINSVLEVEVRRAYAEVIRRAPRDTGALERSIDIISHETQTTLSYMIFAPLGIDPDSWLYPLAVEFGTKNIQVGTPESPRGKWASKSKSGATMPFMRPAAVSLQKRAAKAIRDEILMQIRQTRIVTGV